MSSLRSIAFYLGFSIYASAQLLFFADKTMAKPKRAVIADVTATVTAQTPWGVINQVETGKYWRSSNGQIRQDDEHGMSHLIDLQIPRSSTRIDRELRLAESTKEGGFSRLRQRNSDPTGVDWFRSYKPVKKGEKTLDGRRVTVREVIIGTVKYEAWTSDELKLILYYKFSSGSVQFEQTYTNIRLAEPEPGTFEIPTGFQVRTVFDRLVPGPCRDGLGLQITDGISGQREKTTSVGGIECQQ